MLKLRYGFGLIACMLFSHGSFGCCNRSTVVNNTTEPVAVNWAAYGCFEVHYGFFIVCQVHVLQGLHDQATYEYNPGTSVDRIHFALLFDKKGNRYNSRGATSGSCTVKSPDKSTVYLDKIYVGGRNEIYCETHVVHHK